MNDRRENKLSRNLKVQTFFKSHIATLGAGVPALSTYVSLYNGKTDDCVNYAQEASEDITGASEQKAYLRTLMRDLAMPVSGALYAHFLIIKDQINAKKAHVTKTEIDYARDIDAYAICKRLLEQAQAHSAVIEPLGITALTLTHLETALNNYWNNIQDPQDEISERTAALKGFDKTMAESEEILEILKGIMLTQKTAFPKLHLQFMGSIAIDDNRGGTPSAPGYEFTVHPGAFYTAITLPYVATRRFRAKNLSQESLYWGLSDEETNFTSPKMLLGANKKSDLVSTNLGVSGSYLIFENTTSHPIEIELTVV